MGLTRPTVSYINKMVQDGLGYSVFGYFLFFEEEDAAKLLNEHVSLCMEYSTIEHLLMKNTSPSQLSLCSSQPMQSWGRNTWAPKEVFGSG